MGRPFSCPYCKSTNTVSKGSRKTKGLGLRKLRRCKACGRKFTPRNQKPTTKREEQTRQTPAA